MSTAALLHPDLPGARPERASGFPACGAAVHPLSSTPFGLLPWQSPGPRRAGTRSTFPPSDPGCLIFKKRPMDIFGCDVLVVGGGGAGLRAAIAVAETYPSLSVTVISKVYPMRSHTVSAEGGAAAAIKAGDTQDAHAYDTISGGDWLCDQD